LVVGIPLEVFCFMQLKTDFIGESNLLFDN